VHLIKGIAYATLMRWIKRVSSGREPVEKPGPKKVEPLDLLLVKQSIGSLDHGSKRTAGTGNLHRAFGGAISRWELGDLVRQSRIAEDQRRADALCHLTWLYPTKSGLDHLMVLLGNNNSVVYN
jgi:hypothetical protein